MKIECTSQILYIQRARHAGTGTPVRLHVGINWKTDDDDAQIPSTDFFYYKVKAKTIIYRKFGFEMEVV